MTISTNPATDRLTICLWDFTWYTRTGPGEPFEDLDRACLETVERGFNAIRICAMPLLLFGTDIDTSRLELGPLPAGHGRRTRWYDVGANTTIDAHQHLISLFEACQRHHLKVIISSWEYQQSPSFSLSPEWHEALQAIDPEVRVEALARAEARLLDALDERGLQDVVAFTELHNEVTTGYLAQGLPGREPVVELHDRLARGADVFHELRPQDKVAVNYSRVPLGQMRGVPTNIDVLVCHPYVYGVLQDLIVEYGLRDANFSPEKITRDGLVNEAQGQFPIPEGNHWRFRATIMRQPELWVHDNVNARNWDAWLYERAGQGLSGMYATLDLWLDAARDWSLEHDIPLAFGEGWVGYTPLAGTFEEGPLGQQFILHAMRRSADVDALGTTVCSNAAPHHPMWDDVAFIQEANREFLSAFSGR